MATVPDVNAGAPQSGLIALPDEYPEVRTQLAWHHSTTRVLSFTVEQSRLFHCARPGFALVHAANISLCILLSLHAISLHAARMAAAHITASSFLQSCKLQGLATIVCIAGAAGCLNC